jgi:hypothetical protein
MALPVVQLPNDSLEIGGERVEYRSLSRSEALKVHSYVGNEDEAENFILSCGVGCTVDEARAWRASTDLKTAGLLVDSILVLSGMTKPDKDGKVPNDSTATNET